MSRPLPSAVEQRWQEVLRRADIALQLTGPRAQPLGGEPPPGTALVYRAGPT